MFGRVCPGCHAGSRCGVLHSDYRSTTDQPRPQSSRTDGSLSSRVMRGLDWTGPWQTVQIGLPSSPGPLGNTEEIVFSMAST
jgi:hypothetical protein